MKAVTISLSQIRQVQELVRLLSHFPFDVDMVSGRYTVDAKSILGIYSLDLSKPLKLLIYSDSCEELLKGLQPFQME